MTELPPSPPPSPPTPPRTLEEKRAFAIAVSKAQITTTRARRDVALAKAEQESTFMDWLLGAEQRVGSYNEAELDVLIASWRSHERSNAALNAEHYATQAYYDLLSCGEDAQKFWVFAADRGTDRENPK